MLPCRRCHNCFGSASLPVQFFVDRASYACGDRKTRRKNIAPANIPELMQATPRTLIRQVQKDLSPAGQPTGGPAGKGGARDLMKAFISAEKVLSKEHTKILENPVFAGCYPRIVDKVFFLERFVSELPRSQQHTPSPTNKKQKSMSRGAQNSQNDPHEAFTPSGFTAFEHSLICINITLAIGIVLTLLLLGLFFYFLNSALYLKEEIS